MITRVATLAVLATATLWSVRPAGAQVPIRQSNDGTPAAVQQAEALLRDGRGAAAADLLGRYLATNPNDGRAWFALGNIYLSDTGRWHRDGHPAVEPGALLLEFAGAAMEQAHHLLADSGNVYRVLVSVERTVARIENAGWTKGMLSAVSVEDLPLPPVLRELGRNLMASCPGGGILVTGSLVEMSAVWGTRLVSGDRADLVLVRPDMYAWDARYRQQMAQAIGVDSALTLPAALVQAAARRPVCLTPTVDSLTAPAVEWRPLRLVLAAGPDGAVDSVALTVHQFATTGLTGSVWTEAAREVYDLAARRNRALCTTLFANADARGVPSIASCPR